MSKIAIDARIIASSTGRYVERLLTYLQEVDATNEYVVLVRKKDERYWVPTKGNFRIVIADYTDYSLDEQIGFKQLLDSLDVDLVHFCMPQQPVLYRGKHVTTVHDLTLLQTYNSDKNWFVFRAKQLVGHLVFRRIAHTSAHIITPSLYTKKAYAKLAHIPEEKITVTYEAADAVVGDSQPYQPMQGKEFILYVGQQSDYKNVKRLIQAHQSLLAKRPDLHLVLVGSLNMAAHRNKNWAESRGYKNIIFTGFLDDDLLAWLYQNAQAYIFPSLMEGFGLPGLEAMTYGTPVISSNTTCLPEIYGDAALYFDPKNIITIAQKIELVLSDNGVREDMIAKGRIRVKQFSWKQMAEQTLEVYMAALSQRD